jgi:hypothetical protein
VNELIILTIQLAKITKDVIEVLAIDILSPFSNRCNHIEEIKINALWKMANSNSVDRLVGFNSGLKRDYSSKTRNRKNSDTKDRSFDAIRALPLIVIRSRRGVCISPNGLVVPTCRINVRIGRADIKYLRLIDYL